MAQNGFGRRASHATRTYPGAASRLVNSPGSPPSPPPPVPSSTGRASSSSLGNVPSVFVRPLSRSQLAPMAGGISSPPSPPARPISLDQPRPNAERHRNLYLGAPLPSHTPQIQQQIHTRGHPIIVTGSKTRLDSSITAAEQVRLGVSGGSSSMTRSLKSDKSHRTTEESLGGGVVTSQPIKRGLLDESTESGKVKLAESSIVCPYCRKCRCEACTTPRPLPSRWICSKSIHCGPEPLLDYVTCLCCVKAVFYHCGKNHESDGGVICADKPCSCAPHRKFWRWGCMATMSLVLPCLCLYWPCKGCIHVAEKTYQRYHSGNGCNCHPVGGSSKPMDGGGHEEERVSSDFHGRSTSVGTVRMPTGSGGSSKLLPSSP